MSTSSSSGTISPRCRDYWPLQFIAAIFFWKIVLTWGEPFHGELSYSRGVHGQILTAPGKKNNLSFFNAIVQFMYKSPSFEDQVKPQLHMRPCLCWVFPCLSCLKSTCLNETWVPGALFQALLQENPDLNTLHSQSTSLRVSKSIHLPSTLSLPLFGVCLFVYFYHVFTLSISVHH